MKTHTFLERLKFSYAWDMRFKVLVGLLKVPLLDIAEGLTLFITGLLVLILTIPVWLFSPLYLTIFKPKKVDNVINSKISNQPKKKAKTSNEN